MDLNRNHGNVASAMVLAATLMLSLWVPGSLWAGGLSTGFDDHPVNRVPKGWRIQETNPSVAPAQWLVMADKTAPSKPNVLALTGTKNHGSTFNIVVAENITLKDLALSVKVRAVTGKEDQGGGPIWRVMDANNYYIARYNPLEHNFRLYYVKDGKRKILAGAKRPGIKAGEWFTIKIVHRGDKIEGWLNGEKLLEAIDRTFMEAGGVGVWTKADAATSFDDFTVTALSDGQGGRAGNPGAFNLPLHASTRQ